MRKISFSKYSAAGNDFILIDNREKILPTYDKSLITSLTHRRYGIGADGVIFLEKGEACNYKMRIFNPDGEEASMCGNGLRALTLFIEEKNSKEKEFLIGTVSSQGPYKCSIGKEGVVTQTNGRIEKIEKFSIRTSQGNFEVYFLDSGNPHAVLFFPEIDLLDIDSIGKEISHHSIFSPSRTNVNFVALDKTFLKIRTFEKGVEGETLSCGTGVIASGVVASHLFSVDSPLKVCVQSKDILTLFFKKMRVIFPILH